MLTNCLAAYDHLTITVSEIAKYWSKIVIFSYPLAFDAHVRGGGSRRNIAILFGNEKLEWLRYTTVKKISKISLFILAQFTNVTDGQADRHRMPT